MVRIWPKLGRIEVSHVLGVCYSSLQVSISKVKKLFGAGRLSRDRYFGMRDLAREVLLAVLYPPRQPLARIL